jgi:hypothetical protein
MAEKTWEVSQICFCQHVDQDVALEAEVVHPIDFLPDPPRILARRCSLGVQCNQFEQAACVWAGTNPAHDPFRP